MGKRQFQPCTLEIDLFNEVINKETGHASESAVQPLRANRLSGRCTSLARTVKHDP